MLCLDIQYLFESPTTEQEIQKDNGLKICTVTTNNIQLEQLFIDTYANIIKAIISPEHFNYIWIRKSKMFINYNQILIYLRGNLQI